MQPGEFVTFKAGPIGILSPVIVVAAALAGCQPERPVVVGAALSTSFVNAIRLAVEDGGARLAVDTLLISEATNRAAPALELADRFRRVTGMVAVVAHSNSAASLAAAPIYNEAGIVQVAPTSTAASYSEAGPFSFRLVPPDDAQGVRLAGVLDSLFPAGARVAVLYVNDDYGRGIRRALLPRLAPERFPVVHDQPHSDEELALREDQRRGQVESMVRSLAAAEPQVVIWLGRARTLALHLGPIRDRLGAIPVLGSDALSSWASYDSGAGAWDGVRFVDFLDPAGTDALRAFQRRYRERFGAAATTGDILSYDTMRLLLAAIADGARSGEGVRAWLHGLGRERPAYQGLSGPISFDEAGDVARSHVLITVHAPAR